MSWFGLLPLILISLELSLLIAESQGASCETGWFGSRCQYKCHCVDNRCDANGDCQSHLGCEKGWFGPQCQYVDLTTSKSTESAPSWLYDADDSTCNDDPAVETLTVTFPSIFPIRWMRFIVNDPHVLRNFSIAFNGTSDLSKCPNMQQFVVSDTTIDFFCDTDPPFINQVILTGNGIGSLCSLYISGDRNVALRQNTTQSSTNHLGSSVSSNAVDGNTEADWTKGSCSMTQMDGANPSWKVLFSQRQRINRVALYNRNDCCQEQLQGFRVKLISSQMTSNSTFTSKKEVLDVYTLVIGGLVTFDISIVEILPDDNVTHQFNNQLTLCEVELYGDSTCQAGLYGRECEHTCNCADEKEACFIFTGGCPTSGCADGYRGESCSQPCEAGKYGAGCSMDCYEGCANKTTVTMSTCDHVTGKCLHGCAKGYNASVCQSGNSASKHTVDVAVIFFGVLSLVVRLAFV